MCIYIICVYVYIYTYICMHIYNIGPPLLLYSPGPPLLLYSPGPPLLLRLWLWLPWLWLWLTLWGTPGSSGQLWGALGLGLPGGWLVVRF